MTENPIQIGWSQERTFWGHVTEKFERRTSFRYGWCEQCHQDLVFLHLMHCFLHWLHSQAPFDYMMAAKTAKALSSWFKSSRKENILPYPLIQVLNCVSLALSRFFTLLHLWGQQDWCSYWLVQSIVIIPVVGGHVHTDRGKGMIP